eukprot:6188260-Pleurochrysis_carterae.AAC.3
MPQADTNKKLATATSYRRTDPKRVQATTGAGARVDVVPSTTGLLIPSRRAGTRVRPHRRISQHSAGTYCTQIISR